MLSFHLAGRWPEDAVRCRWAQSSFRPDVEIQERIEAAWAEARGRDGLVLFDGPMCRLESFATCPGGVELALSHTSYKAFWGTNLRNASLADRYGWGALANPVGLSCALISQDDQLMFGRRNERVAYYPGRVHPFAGALEPSDDVNVFEEVRRELKEELSLDRRDLASLYCLGLVEDRSLRQPELILAARARHTRSQIERQVDAAEHHACWSLAATPDAVAQAVRQRLLTPVAVGTLLLWGRVEFGEAWFEPLRREFEHSPNCG